MRTDILQSSFLLTAFVIYDKLLPHIKPAKFSKRFENSRQFTPFFECERFGAAFLLNVRAF